MSVQCLRCLCIASPATSEREFHMHMHRLQLKVGLGAENFVTIIEKETVEKSQTSISNVYGLPVEPPLRENFRIKGFILQIFPKIEAIFDHENTGRL